MKRSLQASIVLLGVLARAMPVYADGNYKSFTVSTYTILGTVEGLLQGNPDPQQSWGNIT